MPDRAKCPVMIAIKLNEPCGPRRPHTRDRERHYRKLLSMIPSAAPILALLSMERFGREYHDKAFASKLTAQIIYARSTARERRLVERVPEIAFQTSA